MRTQYRWVAAAMVLASASLAQAEPSTKLKVVLDPLPDAAPTPAASVAPRPKLLPVVPFRKLMPFLPKPPEGWTSENPTGSETDVEVFFLSTVAQTYHKGDDENAQVATVTIIDTGGHKDYMDAVTAQWNVSNTPEGADKPVKIDDMPGFEHVTFVPKSVSLSVIVAKRFFVQIDLINLDAKDARQWLKKIDLKGLSELN